MRKIMIGVVALGALFIVNAGDAAQQQGKCDDIDDHGVCQDSGGGSGIVTYDGDAAWWYSFYQGGTIVDANGKTWTGKGCVDCTGGDWSEFGEGQRCVPSDSGFTSCKETRHLHYVHCTPPGGSFCFKQH